MGVKAKELGTLKSVLESNEAKKGETDKRLADTTQELEGTTLQMKEDTKFFDETKAACHTKADEWSEHTLLRSEELAGNNKALEVLSSDEACEMFWERAKTPARIFDRLRAHSECRQLWCHHRRGRENDPGSEGRGDHGH